MHSREINELAKEKLAIGFSYRRNSQELNLRRSAVQYMTENDFSRVKSKRGPMDVAVGFKKLYKTMHCSSEKTQRKGDSLKSPEADTPRYQQKNGL